MQAGFYLEILVKGEGQSKHSRSLKYYMYISIVGLLWKIMDVRRLITQAMQTTFIV